MSTMLWIVLVIAAVCVVAGLTSVALVLRETWSSRHEWAAEDREADDDEGRGVAD